MAEQENPMTKLLGYRKDDTDNIFWLVLYKNGKEDWKTDKEVRENEKWGELSCRISIPNRHSLGELPPPPPHIVQNFDSTGNPGMKKLWVGRPNPDSVEEARARTEPSR
eukprot:g74349.t1